MKDRGLSVACSLDRSLAAMSEGSTSISLPWIQWGAWRANGSAGSGRPSCPLAVAVPTGALPCCSKGISPAPEESPLTVMQPW